MTAAGWFWVSYFCLALTALLWITGCGDSAKPPQCSNGSHVVQGSGGWYCEQAGKP